MELSVVEKIVLDKVEELCDSIEGLISLYRNNGTTIVVNSIQNHANEIDTLIDVLTEYKSEMYRTSQKEKKMESEMEDDLK